MGRIFTESYIIYPKPYLCLRYVLNDIQLYRDAVALMISAKEYMSSSDLIG